MSDVIGFVLLKKSLMAALKRMDWKGATLVRGFLLEAVIIIPARDA